MLIRPCQLFGIACLELCKFLVANKYISALPFKNIEFTISLANSFVNNFLILSFPIFSVQNKNAKTQTICYN